MGSLLQQSSSSADAISADLTALYDGGISFNKSLPILKFREKIIAAVETSNVVFVHGATGCGKTTQIPQYILDDQIRKGQMPYIVVTQPRRIAAVSIARHVSEEHGWELGGIVGYQIAQEVSLSASTRIVYCTLGVFLQQMIHFGNLDKLTHIILDEIHEREEDMDLALLLIKKLQRQKTRPVKLIVMSATMHMEKLSKYLEDPPVIAVESGVFKVDIKYLDDISQEGGGFMTPYLSLDDPWMQPALQDFVARLILSFDKKELENVPVPACGSVLIFVPGFRDIVNLIELLKLQRKNHERRWEIIPLHSKVSSRDQQAVFLPHDPAVRRIIVATNIAESSITVPHVKYIIDFCLTKQISRDDLSSYSGLNLAWAAKSNCDQRKGRAGRVSEGTAYRMVTKEFYDKLSEHGVPEILRVPLHSTILKVKKLGIRGNIYDILGECLDPPEPAQVTRSVLELMEAGALTIATDSTVDGDLTTFGHIMSGLPLDISLSRLIILATCFGFVDEAIIIAACLASRSFFEVNFGKDVDRYSMKMQWDRGHHSDLNAALAAFQAWECQRAVFKARPDEEREWCRTFSVAPHRINEVSLLVEDLRQRVDRMELVYNSISARKPYTWSLETGHVDEEVLLQFLIAGAFYPNYFFAELARTQLPVMSSDEQSTLKRSVTLLTDCSDDSMVCLTGVSSYFQKYLGIKPESVTCKEGIVSVTFHAEEATQIPLAVYRSVKLRDFQDVPKVIEPSKLILFQPRAVTLMGKPAAATRLAQFTGPISVLEVPKFHGLTPDIDLRTARIDFTSVNSVVINDASEKGVSRLLVAAAVMASSSTDKRLLLDSTTLVNGQIGLSGLILLAFSPAVTLIMEKSTNCCVGMRGGLGMTETAPRKEIMSDHAFRHFFDTKFTADQIGAVQLLRTTISDCFAPHLMKDRDWRRMVVPKYQELLREIFSFLMAQNYGFVSQKTIQMIGTSGLSEQGL